MADEEMPGGHAAASTPATPVTIADPAPPPLPPANPGEGTWLSLAAAVGGVAGAAAIVYALGGAVMLLRLNGAGVDANQALGAIPQQTLFAVGAEKLVLPVGFAVAFYFFILFMERRTRQAGTEQASAEKKSVGPSRKVRALLGTIRGVVWLWRSRLGRIARKVLGVLLYPLLVAIRWYVRFVPIWIISWLPILLFLPNPSVTVVNAIVATVSAGIPDWAGQGTRPRREFALRSALALALISVSAGLASELLHPGELPPAKIENIGGKVASARFVAVSDDSAYLVEGRKLTIVPSTSYRMLVVEDTKTKSVHEPSIASRLWPW